jgi:RimJ/RimL family protein N-acetyltransferase
MLEGRNVDLKMGEKEDLPILLEWLNNPEFSGQFDPLEQVSMAEMEKGFDRRDRKHFFIQKKDGTKVGAIESRDVVPNRPEMFGVELGYFMSPGERGKGYCTEAINILLDYVFLSTPAIRIQVHTDMRNAASQRVMEKTGFRKEGIVRKGIFTWGEWRDGYLYSILRDEWKGPRILKATI